MLPGDPVKLHRTKHKQHHFGGLQTVLIHSTVPEKREWIREKRIK